MAIPTSLPFRFSLLLTFLTACNTSNDPVFSGTSDYFKIATAADTPLDKPLPFEWRYMHNEKAQTFPDYKKLPLTPGKSRIYLLPIGHFNALQAKAILSTREYIELFYQQPAILLPTFPDSLVPATARRLQTDKHIQLLAPYLLDSLLTDKLPQDGIALMAISAEDLYPANGWNFVFGLSSYSSKVGVTSIYRFQNYSLADSANFQLTLRRLISISSHELGHMMQMKHCLHAKCVMNGTNSLGETDKSPNRLCSECQKKMFWKFRYDNVRRLKQLTAFFKKAGLQNDYQTLKPELEAVEQAY